MRPVPFREERMRTSLKLVYALLMAIMPPMKKQKDFIVVLVTIALVLPLVTIAIVTTLPCGTSGQQACQEQTVAR